MKKLLIGVLILGVLGAIVYFSMRSGDGGDGVEIDSAKVVQRELTELVKTSGQVDARVKVNISSPLIAKITSLFVKEGDQVEAGARFLELEKEAFVAARDDWTSRLAVARNDVAQAQVSLADARIRADRAERLLGEGISSQEALEAARLARDSAELQLERARQSIHQAEANLTKARDDLAKTTLYSPISGRVVTLNAEEGEVVVSGTMNNPASVIGTVADLSEILAEVDVDETEIVKVKVGQSASLAVEAVLDQRYQGTVVEVGNSGYSKASQPDVTFFKVKLLFTDADEKLRPGMSVRADIKTATVGDALVVPIQAVVNRRPLGEDGKEVEAGGDEEEVSVVFLIEDGKARQQTVETGLSDETHVQVLSGVAADDQVATGPYRTLKNLDNDDEVKIREPKESSGDDDDDDEEE